MTRIICVLLASLSVGLIHGQTEMSQVEKSKILKRIVTEFSDVGFEFGLGINNTYFELHHPSQPDWDWIKKLSELPEDKRLTYFLENPPADEGPDTLIKDEHDDWFKLVKDQDILNMCRDVSLYDLSWDGFRFYLALYMYLSIQTEDHVLGEKLINDLTDLRWEKMRLLRTLDKAQRSCTAEVLNILSENHPSSKQVDRCRLKMALDDFWEADLTDHEPPKYFSHNYLLELVENAFDGVTLENGVSLHTTVYSDAYGLVGDRTKRQMEQDERFDWRKLVNDPELYLVDGIGGLAFYDEKGLRFHLPAYICLALQDVRYGVILRLVYTLTDVTNSSYGRSKLSLLTAEQKYCVAQFLKFLRDTTYPYSRENEPSIDNALCVYWLTD